MIVKFREGTRVRRGARGLEGAASFDPARLTAVLARHGLAPGALRRLLALPESRLDDAPRARASAAAAAPSPT